MLLNVRALRALFLTYFRVMRDVRGVDETSMIAKLNDQSLLFISLPRDSDSCSYARKYCQPSGKLPCPAILAIKEAWSPDAENVPKHNLLYAYEIQDRACMPENLDSIGIVEQIGRTIHEQYLRDQVRAGFAMGSKPAMKSWEELDPTFRTSSNYQAASIVGNLQQSGYDLEAMTSLGQAYVGIDKEDVVHLAQREHERYCQERVLTDSAAANWTWEQLKEGDRNTACDQVRSWPWILAQQGILLKKPKRT